MATTKVTVTLRNKGDLAGLVLLGKDYGSVVIVKTLQGNVLRQIFCIHADLGSPEEVAAEVPLAQDQAYLRVEVNEGKISFSYSLNGQDFEAIGQTFRAQAGVWTGAKIGIFASGNADRGELGYADFDWFRLSALK